MGNKKNFKLRTEFDDNLPKANARLAELSVLFGQYTYNFFERAVRVKFCLKNKGKWSKCCFRTLNAPRRAPQKFINFVKKKVQCNFRRCDSNFLYDPTIL